MIKECQDFHKIYQIKIPFSSSLARVSLIVSTLAHMMKEIKNGSQKGGAAKGGKKEAAPMDKAPAIFLVQT